MTITNEQASWFAETFGNLVRNVEGAVLGKTSTVRLALTCLLSEGHLLLEDVPGTGKTSLAKALANTVKGTQSRLQFTPDLLPSDVTGATIYNQQNQGFEFHPGPVFASIVLVDEINRASPKTQSALLEVMEEGHVTVDGIRHDVGQPFMVIATQNPVEQAGVYPLPEAQLDRFLMRTSLGYPDHDTTVALLAGAAVRDRAALVKPLITADAVKQMGDLANQVNVDTAVLSYVSRLAEESRRHPQVKLGVSTRGCLALTRAVKTWAVSQGRSYVVPDDVKDLAGPVLGHRILLSPDAEFSGGTAEGVLAQVLADVAPPTERGRGLTVVAVGGLARRVRAVWDAITPLGRAVGAGGLLCWALAWRFDWAELAVVAVAGLLALAVGVAFLAVGGSDLSVLLDLATPRVVVGDAAATTVEAVNDSDRRALPVRLEARVGRGLAHVDVPSLAAGASHDEVFVIPTSRRSVVPVGPVRSVQGDPLGLVRRERVWTGTEHLYVHPRTVRVSALATGWMRDLEGETTNDRSPSDVAFHTLREYVVGDDRRHIHWRTSARQTDGKLMVREFVDTRRAHLGLVLSQRSEDYASDDEFELAVSIVGSLGLRALADEQDLTCLAGPQVVPAFAGPTFLDALAGLELGSDDLPVAMVAARGRDLLRGVSVAAVVTGSAADPAALRSASDRLGATVHTVLVRVVGHGHRSAMAMAGRSPLLEVGSLDDLPRLVFAVTSR